jgi:hypothetical protein
VGIILSNYSYHSTPNVSHDDRQHTARHHSNLLWVEVDAFYLNVFQLTLCSQTSCLKKVLEIFASSRRHRSHLTSPPSIARRNSTGGSYKNVHRGMPSLMAWYFRISYTEYDSPHVSIFAGNGLLHLSDVLVFYVMTLSNVEVTIIAYVEEG